MLEEYGYLQKVYRTFERRGAISDRQFRPTWLTLGFYRVLCERLIEYIILWRWYYSQSMQRPRDTRHYLQRDLWIVIFTKLWYNFLENIFFMLEYCSGLEVAFVRRWLAWMVKFHKILLDHVYCDDEFLKSSRDEDSCTISNVGITCVQQNSHEDR